MNRNRVDDNVRIGYKAVRDREILGVHIEKHIAAAFYLQAGCVKVGIRVGESDGSRAGIWECADVILPGITTVGRHVNVHVRSADRRRISADHIPRYILWAAAYKVQAGSVLAGDLKSFAGIYHVEMNGVVF